MFFGLLRNVLKAALLVSSLYAFALDCSCPRLVGKGTSYVHVLNQSQLCIWSKLHLAGSEKLVNKSSLNSDQKEKCPMDRKSSLYSA